MPLHPDGVRPLGDRVDLEGERRQELRKRQAVEHLGGDEGRVVFQSPHKCRLAAADGRGAKQQILVDAVIGEEGGDARGVARVERGVQPLDRARWGEHLARREVVRIEHGTGRAGERRIGEAHAGAIDAVRPDGPGANSRAILRAVLHCDPFS